MEIWHRVAFNADVKPNFKSEVDKLGLKYKLSPLPGHMFGLVSFEISELDARWLRVHEMIRTEGASDIYNTVFTKPEILSAKWIRLMPTFEQGYPQPEEGWTDTAYVGKCPQCGAGYRQKAPFHLAKEPRLGRHSFMSLYWAYTVFTTPQVLAILDATDIRGYERWDALMHRTGQPSQVVSQLFFPVIAEPGLAEEDKLQPETCPQCGLTKYGYHKRGYMRLKRAALRSDVDVQLTHEWFGSGGHSGFREILISNRLARLILENNWRGVSLKPVELI